MTRGWDVELMFEPGRVIAGNAGVLLTEVIWVKPGVTNPYVIVDAAMNDLARPALYDAWHDFVAVEPSGRADDGEHRRAGVRERRHLRDGPRDRRGRSRGDLAVFRTAGAYGATMASTYNSRALVPEVHGRRRSLRGRRGPRRTRNTHRRRARPGVAEEMTWHSLPLFVRLEGRPVILLGEGEAADAKRRLLERAGARIVDEEAHAALAIVAIEDEAAAQTAVARLKARGVLVNAVDRPALCDFTLPAIVDRDPVLVAIGTGGVSAGLAAALRQRLEAILPATLGGLAEALHAARDRLRARFPDGGERRRAIAEALAPGGPLDPLGYHSSPERGGGPAAGWWRGLSTNDTAGGQPPPPLRGGPAPRPGEESRGETATIALTSPDPDDLTLRQARLLANADRVVHTPGVPAAILDRARADAARLTVMPDDAPGLTVIMEMA